ncbi:GDSL-type esterase/lipase family protein [Rhizobium sp. 2MFCol3.1]|uniref:GDSL-type esterase/lipase family protein n=1 Tax=Rhizobium sp. 2MFCol3.1 TaxID=1246459 RepID=UPI001FDA1A50|nr:GDSL-type esterase/lipase family protein [Rhizobium sp. 2MFCol3.1]
MGFGFSFSLSPQGTTTPAAPPTAAPTVTTAPAISGTPQSGSTLTTTFGVWTQSPSGYVFQWKAAGTNISGATSRTYDLTDAEVGKTITVTVTASNSFGSASSTSVATAAVTAKPVTEKPANTAVPTISGNTLVGSTLMTSTGTWAYSPSSYAYQWFKNGTALSGATANVFALLAEDYGSTFYARVTATNVVGSSDAFTPSVGPVSQNVPANTVAPSISGLAQVTKTLTGSAGTWTNSPSLTYQWLRDGVVISGATDTTYVLDNADKGKLVSFRVTATNLGGSTLATSSEVGPIAQPAQFIKIVSEGDSLTAGALTSNESKAYPPVAVATLAAGPTYSLSNIATGGYTGQNVADEFDDRGGAAFDETKDMNVFSVMLGANDRSQGYNDRQAYVNLRRVLVAAKRRGYQRRIVGSMIASNEGDAPYQSWNVADVQFNTWVRAYALSDLDCDGLFDFGADPRFDTAADANNTTWYASDRNHLTDAGYAALAGIYRLTLQAAINAPGVRQALPPTWFAPDMSKSMALKNSDRTVYWPDNGFTNACVRGAIGKSSGKWYFETVHNSVGNDKFTGIGLMNIDYATHLEADWIDPGQDENAIGYQSNEGTIRYMGTDIAYMGQIENGDIVGIAFDADTRRMWVRRNSGLWNGGAAEGSEPFDPATGVGGIDISMLGTDMLYPVGFAFLTGCEITSRFAPGQTTLPIPSGFTVIGG